MPGFRFSRHKLLVALLIVFAVLQLSPVMAHAQNLGGSPQVNKAVQAKRRRSRRARSSTW